MKSFIFSKWSFNYSDLSDILAVKGKAANNNNIFANLLAKLKLIAGGKVSKSFYIHLLSIHKQLKAIQSSQGDRGLILFLKAAQVSLQQAASAYKVKDMRKLGARISRTKGSLLPRIIPSPHRKIIINSMPGKYILLKFYLTLFYSYRVIKVNQYTLDLSTITKSGVLDPKQFIPKAYYFMFLKAFLKTKWTMLYNPLDSLLKFGKLFSILKSSPNNVRHDEDALWSTHPLVLFRSMMGIVKSSYWTDFKALANAYHPKLRNVLTPFVTNSDMMELANAKFTNDGKPASGIQSSTGKLSFKEEAAGKLRVFAIVDGLTQWLLYPIHKLIFKLLRYIPMDGTFNQLRPIHRLLKLKAKSFYSLDLSAATDRLPLAIQEHLLNEWFSAVPNFGTHWANILVKRSYRYFVDPQIGYKFKKEFGFMGSVKYRVGQPMGALSSWAMLALTHHFLVQVSAWRIGFVKPGTLYTKYALLGDDLVIADKPVAKSYIWLMTKIGVAINLNKSILSPSGKGLEFAKRTFIDGTDVSPISLQELSLSLVPGNVSN